MNYKLFFTPMCPNCPKVKEFMKGVEMPGELVDATTDNGFEQAQKFEVNSVPTVIFLDSEKVISVAHSIEEVKRIIENKRLF
jgi:ribonucleoside-triphosphate reductase